MGYQLEHKFFQVKLSHLKYNKQNFVYLQRRGQRKLPPFSFSVCIYFVGIERKTLAKTYAASYIVKEDALWVAEELYSIMEESIQYDPLDLQETTKEFLVDIIQIMNGLDKEYTEKITALYLDLALQSASKTK